MAFEETEYGGILNIRISTILIHTSTGHRDKAFGGLPHSMAATELAESQHSYGTGTVRAFYYAQKTPRVCTFC
jgi:hypothetical protein